MGPYKLFGKVYPKFSLGNSLEGPNSKWRPTRMGKNTNFYKFGRRDLNKGSNERY